MGGYGWGESVGGGGESAALWCGSRKEEQDMQDLERKAGAGGELGRHTRAARRGGGGEARGNGEGGGELKASDASRTAVCSTSRNVNCEGER